METMMSDEAIVQGLYGVWALRETVMQTWLTITFGAILAIYFSIDHLTRFLRALVVGLYVMSSLTLITAWFNTTAHAAFFYGLLLAKEGLGFPEPIFSWAAPMLIILIVTGTIATAYFLVTFKGK